MFSRSASGSYSTENYFFDVKYQTNESFRRIQQAANQVAEAMADTCKSLDALIKPGKQVLRRVRDADHRWNEGLERKIVSNFLEAEEGLTKLRDVFLQKENAAICDPQLYGKNQKKVVDGYRRGAKTIAEIIKILQSIRWAVMENSEDLDEVVQSESAEDFLAKVG